VTEALLAVLVVAVIALAVIVIRAQRREDDPDDGRIEQRMMEMMQAQQLLVGKVDTVSKQQVESAKAVTDTVSRSQANLSQTLGERLAKVETEMSKNLASSSKETAESLAGLKERLETIDKAQDNIKALSEQVVSLQHVLDDNPARGAFGEVQLADIVESMLPSFAYQMQAMLLNGKQVDCLIKLPDPPGPISVDAKFPLKAYQELLAADNQIDRDKAGKQLANDTKKHIKDIAEKYVGQAIDDDTSTAENALMFIPSEAVYGELHANHPSVIAESHRRKVYLVSPTTLMATLTTVRAILRDVEMRSRVSTDTSTRQHVTSRTSRRVPRRSSAAETRSRASTSANPTPNLPRSTRATQATRPPFRGDKRAKRVRGECEPASVAGLVLLVVLAYRARRLALPPRSSLALVSCPP